MFAILPQCVACLCCMQCGLFRAWCEVFLSVSWQHTRDKATLHWWQQNVRPVWREGTADFMEILTMLSASHPTVWTRSSLDKNLPMIPCVHTKPWSHFHQRLCLAWLLWLWIASISTVTNHTRDPRSKKHHDNQWLYILETRLCSFLQFCDLKFKITHENEKRWKLH